jgi:PBP1b-binding outer membrane lipoprotein LpoB
MKMSVFYPAMLVGASLMINGCSQQAEPEHETDTDVSASDAKDAARQRLTRARQSAEVAAAEVVQAARLSVTAAKLAVASGLVTVLRRSLES